ncbi:inositol monophosphatase family protein [Catenulispora pinisilvae]|uniref:inositol monophosphatase family protein n=1 Tax=Catenulispora pinisilvae TaxID=2705253 RepID=UPI0018916BEC|nr:inositol monophosphatase [Catenulispora pinisilvae]
MDDLTLAHHLADQADVTALRSIAAGGIRAQIKPDGSPVTAVDRQIEDVLRASLRRQRPDDAFLGEEHGAHGVGHRRWIVDAIDGTASFLAGRPEWGTLIALQEHGTVTTGLVSAPALGRRWWAVPGSGAWTCPPPISAQPPRCKVTVAPPTDLRDATIGIWPPPSRLPEAARTVAARLAAHAKATRPALNWMSAEPAAVPIPKPSTGSGTCHGGLLVATGQLDAFLLLGAGLWDIAALIPIVREAGGAYTDFSNISDISDSRQSDAQAALFSTTRLHQQILDITS